MKTESLLFSTLCALRASLSLLVRNGPNALFLEFTMAMAATAALTFCETISTSSSFRMRTSLKILSKPSEMVLWRQRSSS